MNQSHTQKAHDQHSNTTIINKQSWQTGIINNASWRIGKQHEDSMADLPHRDTWIGTNKKPVDSGWPARPAQQMLNEYIGNSQAHSQQRQWRADNNPADHNIPWGDHNPNEEGPGPRPDEMAERRDHTPLEYVWRPQPRHYTKIHSNMTTKCQ
jgi:hypothetical protein